MGLLRPGPGLVRTAGRTAVIAGTATAVSGRVAHRQQEKYYGQQQQEVQYVEAPAPAAAPAAPAGDDLASQVQQLSSLHDSGVLSDEEFAAAKAKLLGGG
jgi:hypothetical protein